MSKLDERVDALEEIIKPQAESSPWFQEAMQSLTDEDLGNGRQFILSAVLRRQEEATPAQWDAFEKLCRKEAQLKEAAVRSGEYGSETPVLIDLWDELRSGTI
jgi:hypothetical protein